MGLDMYLTKKKYIWSEERKNLKITGTKTKVNPDKVSYIVEEVGYWRKANAIHNWFVRNVQGGTDDCGTYYVPSEKLKELRDICQQVLDGSELVEGKVSGGYTFETGEDGKMERKEIWLDGKLAKNPELAGELLPTGAGFFFGSTEYDEYYFKQLQDTIEIINDALSGEEGELEYYSSW